MEQSGVNAERAAMDEFQATKKQNRTTACTQDKKNKQRLLLLLHELKEQSLMMAARGADWVGGFLYLQARTGHPSTPATKDSAKRGLGTLHPLADGER